MRFVGLDISTTSASLAILRSDGTCELHALQTPAELGLYLHESDLLIAEWSGAFARPWLDQAIEISPQIYLYHPRALKHERHIVGESRKDDDADARALAKLAHLFSQTPYAPRYKLTPYRQVQEGYRLRAFVMNAERYTRQLVRTKQLLWAANLTGAQIDIQPVEKALQDAEKHALRQLEAEILNTCPEVYRALQRLYPSAYATILKITAYIHPISRFPTPASLVRYAGLYDFKARSGKLIARTPTKPGNKRLRTALYQLALGARGTKSRWRPYYEHLRKRKLSDRKALNRIMTRMLREIHTVASQAEQPEPPPPAVDDETEALTRCHICGTLERLSLLYHAGDGKYRCENCLTQEVMPE